MSRASLKQRVALFALGIAAALSACDQPKQPCDPGQNYTLFLCTNPPPDAAPQAPTGDGGAGDASGAACENYKGFGDKCAVDSDCPCNLVCNPIAKYCTRIKCLADPTICPPAPGYTCMDISMFDPVVGSTCFKN